MSLTNHSRVALVTSFLSIAVAVGCSGTTLKPTDGNGNATSGTDPNGTGATSGNGNGNGSGSGNGNPTSGGSSSDGDAGGNGAPTTCPCGTGYYCDLSTNSCKPGCVDNSQCTSTQICDTASRTCKDLCTGNACNAPACPIPAAPAGDAGAGICNGVALQGAAAATTCHPGAAAPAPAGGTVRDGIYVFIGADEYGTATCAPGSSAQATWDICGSTWATVQNNSQGTATFTLTASISGTNANLTESCPTAQDAGAVGFTATIGTLDLFWPDGAGGTVVEHYTKE